MVQSSIYESTIRRICAVRKVDCIFETVFRTALSKMRTIFHIDLKSQAESDRRILTAIDEKQTKKYS